MDVSSAVVKYSNPRRSSSIGEESMVKNSTASVKPMNSLQQQQNSGDDGNCAIVFTTTKIRVNDELVQEQQSAAVPCVTVRTSIPTNAEVEVSQSIGDLSIECVRKVNTSEPSVKTVEGDNDSIASSVGSDTSRSSLKTEHKQSNASILSGVSSISSNGMKSIDTVSNDDNDTSTCTSETPSQGEKSRIASVIKKAKNKGRKLLSSTKSKKQLTELVDEASQVILQGDEISNYSQESGGCNAKSESLLHKWLQSTIQDDGTQETDSCLPNSQQTIFHPLIVRFYKLPFFRHRMTVFFLLLSLTWISPGFFLGLMWGLYIAVVAFLFFFVSEPVPAAKQFSRVSANVLPEVAEAKGNQQMGKVVYKGWLNQLRGRYDSAVYHVNSTYTVMVRLDGHILKVSRPERVVLKHAFHIDPTLTEPEPKIVGQSIYDLTGAKVSLRPKRLAARRWWSRKYPIHIRFPSPQSELTTVDTNMQRSQSFHQTDRVMDSSLGKKMETSKEGEESYYSYDVDSDTEGSADVEPSKYPQLSESGRSNSTGNLSNFPESTEFSNHAQIKLRGSSLFFFVRSAREKERWFHRLREACSQYRRPPGAYDILDCLSPEDASAVSSKNGTLSSKKTVLSKFFERSSSVPSVPCFLNSYSVDLEYLKYISNRVQFQKSMTEVLHGLVSGKKEEGGGIVHMDLGRINWEPGVPAGRELVLAANAVAARIFFDFCRDNYWCSQVKNKIQSKLATIHLPYFIETLELSNFDLGNVTPEIVAVYSPILDDWGLWVDFELKYHGRIHLVLETRVNLLKLRDGYQRVEAKKKASKLTSSIRAHHYSDDDLPESPESSADEDFGSKTEKATSTKERTGRKILSIVDKIASSKYFQGASQLKPVKKMMEEISSTRLMLNVYVTCVEGTMTLNIPPPPSDRLWYAFRRPPTVSIHAVPQVGDRSVDLSTISDWIENKLRLLIEKFLVCPNMDDIIVPVMSGNQLLQSGYNK